MRQRKQGNAERPNRSQIIDDVSISERPEEIEYHAIPNHWEEDLLSGSKNTHIVTLEERQSRFTLLVKINRKDTKTMVSALIKKIKKLPKILCKSLT